MASPGLTMGSFAGCLPSGGGASIKGRLAEKQDRCPGRAANCWGSRTLERSRTTFASVSLFCRTFTSLSYRSLTSLTGGAMRPALADGPETRVGNARVRDVVDGLCLAPCPAHGKRH